MSLEKTIVPVNLKGGLDTKTDSKLSARLTLLENGVFFEKDKIKKRNGYDALGRSILGSASTISSGQALGRLKDELLMVSANRLYSYSSAEDSWIDKGTVYSLKVKNQSVVRNAAQQSSPDMALASGVILYAWADSRGGVRASVVEQSSGAQFQSDVQISATGANPRCLKVGTSLIVFYTDSTSLKCKILNPGAPTTFGSEITLQSDLSGTESYFDAEALNQDAVVAYRTTAAIKVMYVTSTGVVGTTAIGYPNATAVTAIGNNCVALAVDQTSGNIFLLWHSNASGTQYAVLASDFSSILAATTIEATTTPVTLRISAIATSATALTVFYEVNATNSYDHYIKTALCTSAGVVSGVAVLKRSVGLATKVFQYNSVIYLNVVYDSTLQSTFFTMLSDGTLLAKYLPGQAGGIRAARTLSSTVALSSTEFGFPAPIKTKIVTEDNTTFTVKGVSLSTLTFGDPTQFQSAEMGENLHFSGGFISMYDGVSVVEHGFHLFPENVASTPTTSGGSMADGTYLYYVVWEWIDNRGQLHRSAPSVAVSATVSGGSGAGKVTLAIPTLRLTAKASARSNATISIYRTKKDQVAVAYKVTSISSPTYNDTTVDSVSYIDLLADASIATSEILYTTGGVVENIPAPSCTNIDVYENRMLVTGLEDELEAWYSKIKLPGEGVAFFDGFRIRCNPLGGRLTVGKMMDDKIILFKEALIFYVAGQGPVDTGEQNDFTNPILVSSDVGCTDPASVVLTPKGLMFKSSKGIYLLSRSLEVSYIGADVEAYNSQTITAAKLVEDRNQVRFLSASGSALVYDYFFGEWSTFTNHEGSDAVIWDDAYCYLRADGAVYKESLTSFLDGALEFRLRIGTAWIKMAGVQGYQRVWRAAVLGDYKSNHILQMRVGYDYEDAYVDAYYFAAGDVLESSEYGSDIIYGSTVYGGTADTVYQFRAHLRRQKCQAVRFLFEDVTAGTPGEGYSLSDLSLEIGIKKGLNKLRSAKSVG